MAKDFSGAIPHLRKLLLVMGSVFPENFPELGDFDHALGVCLFNYLQARGSTLPKKRFESIKHEIKNLFQTAWRIRRISLGEGHTLTHESKEMVDAILSAGG